MESTSSTLFYMGLNHVLLLNYLQICRLYWFKLFQHYYLHFNFNFNFNFLTRFFTFFRKKLFHLELQICSKSFYSRKYLQNSCSLILLVLFIIHQHVLHLSAPQKSITQWKKKAPKVNIQIGSSHPVLPRIIFQSNCVTLRIGIIL